MPTQLSSPATGQGKTDMRAKDFLRSINLRFDADHPERIGHFRPTAKTAGLLTALAGESPDEKALLIVAPYGSGKSLAAEFTLQLIENRPEAAETLERIEQRLVSVTPDLAKYAAERRRRRNQGLVIALHGDQLTLSEAIKTGALESMKRLRRGREARTIQALPAGPAEDSIKLLHALQEKAISLGLDRIVILWDEFGRYLETLISEGRTPELLGIQQLAEFCSRSKEIPITLGLILHKSLLNYAGGLPQSIRAEWKKIEGRFNTIQYVDDSREIHRLIAEIVASRASGVANRRKVDADGEAKKAKELGLFPEYSEEELRELFAEAYPLEPTTLYLLPRLSARVAQNERTLFSFLFHTDLDSPVAPANLYDYFSADMQSDTAVGGTYRQWVETQSAISKAQPNSRAADALKAACLLGLGLGGERSKTSRKLLHYSLEGHGNTSGATRVISSLIKKNLLLLRRHNDEVSVWHGTDLDLRGRLEEEKDRARHDFNLIEFLSTEIPPPVWTPVQHNDEFHIRRFLESQFTSATELSALLELQNPDETVPPGCDGRIFYVLPRDQEELDTAKRLVETQLTHPQILAVLPRRDTNLFEPALEIAALHRMLMDPDLLEADPLAATELEQMIEDARTHLDRLVQRVIEPTPNGSIWFHSRSAYEISSAKDLRKFLSSVMNETFPDCPKIRNEMVVRRKPSAVVVNARKKLLLGILDRAGQENLGILGNFPDASMFRTVLLHTGIYRSAEPGDLWRFASPAEIDDPGLSKVWADFQRFLTEPSDHYKDFEAFFLDLQRPPIGLRPGLIPVLLGAAFRAFPSGLSLVKSGEYVKDILPSVIEDIVKDPKPYRLRVVALSEKETAFLEQLSATLLNAPPSAESAESDPLRRAYEAWELWKAQLPTGVRTTRHLSPEGGKVRDLAKATLEPAELLLHRLPNATFNSAHSEDEAWVKLKRSIQELEDLSDLYVSQAAFRLKQLLELSGAPITSSAIETAKSWSSVFPPDFARNLPDSGTRALLKACNRGYDSDKMLVNALGSVLISKPLGAWDDRSLREFETKITQAVHSIETQAVALADQPESPLGTESRKALSFLLKKRVEASYSSLLKLAGETEAENFLNSLRDRQAT